MRSRERLGIWQRKLQGVAVRFGSAGFQPAEDGVVSTGSAGFQPALEFGFLEEACGLRGGLGVQEGV